VRFLHSLARRRRDEEQGFTLIELMVVVLIIAILIAIAIPTFLGARTRANDRAAQSSLRNALTAAKTSFTDTSDYSLATGPTLHGIEPSLTFVIGTVSTDFKTISVVAPVSPYANWWAVVKSKSGSCFGIEDKSGSGGGTFYAGPGSATPAPCTAPAADPGFLDANW
jgi:type IV pilus assembly protein PilA